MAVSAEQLQWAYRVCRGRDPSPEDLQRAAPWASGVTRLLHFLLHVDDSAQAPAPVGAPPAAEIRALVTWAYRLLLLREPESTTVVDNWLTGFDRRHMLQQFLQSPEFIEKARHWADDFHGETLDPPLPPLQLRRTVGPVELQFWDNPSGKPVFEAPVAAQHYAHVFDFGCGCGRTARQLMQQQPAPQSYVGVDLNRESIAWCSAHFSTGRPNYQFFHLDAFNQLFNPAAKADCVPFPVGRKFSLVNAHSVFTHIVEAHLDHYLAECARVLDADGVFRSTWFVFDKTAFPMMQAFQNGLYINLQDPTNATIFDHRFVLAKFAQHGLVVWKILQPAVRGFHWTLFASHRRDGLDMASFPADSDAIGIVRPPT